MGLDERLDKIYDEIDSLMWEGEFGKCDALLESVDIGNNSSVGLLGYLTATLPARSKLSYRAKFFEKVEEEIIRRREYEKGLLEGLG